MCNLTVEYWVDDEWYVGRLKEVPGVFSQGETIDELLENIKDAYNMILEESQFIPAKEYKTFEIRFDL